MKSEIEVIDATRLRDSLQCLRLYYWSHERCIQPVAPRLPLVHGSAVHACLAAHYEGEPAGVCLSKYEEVWEAEMLPWIEQQSLIGEVYEDQKRNPVRWMKVFMVYRQFYEKEPFKVRTVKKNVNGQLVDRPAAEVPFLVPLTDNLALGGVTDLLIDYCGQTMVVDHKTTYTLQQSYFDSFNPNHQFSVYLLAVNEIIKPVRPITTLLVNCILNHATEMRPEKLFARVPTTRNKDQLEQAKIELTNWWGIVRECRRTGHWPRNDDRCQRWAGGCSYHSLCTDIQADYRKLIPSKKMFKEQQWDPIRELRKHGLDGGLR